MKVEASEADLFDKSELKKSNAPIYSGKDEARAVSSHCYQQVVKQQPLNVTFSDTPMAS